MPNEFPSPPIDKSFHLCIRSRTGTVQLLMELLTKIILINSHGGTARPRHVVPFVAQQFSHRCNRFVIEAAIPARPHATENKSQLCRRVVRFLMCGGFRQPQAQSTCHRCRKLSLCALATSLRAPQAQPHSLVLDIVAWSLSLHLRVRTWIGDSGRWHRLCWRHPQ